MAETTKMTDEELERRRSDFDLCGLPEYTNIRLRLGLARQLVSAAISARAEAMAARELIEQCECLIKCDPVVAPEYSKWLLAREGSPVDATDWQRRAEQAEAALEKCGTHHVTCEKVSTPVFDGDKRDLVCDCGFEAALAARGGEKA